jgi:hypothetical protein
MKKIDANDRELGLGFEEACEIATWEAALAKGTSLDGMAVLAWYDRRSRRSSPEVGFDEGQVVNWAASGASRGADVWVELDGGRYIFLCGSSLKH